MPKLNFNADKMEMAASDVGEVPHDPRGELVDFYDKLFLAKCKSPLYGVRHKKRASFEREVAKARQNLTSMLTRWKWLPRTLVRFLTTPGGKLVDFYDGGDHVRIWGLKFRKDEYLGSEILRTEKNIWSLRLTAS